ncbi:dihydrolipoyllysine-residue acetyltransferase [Comamonadaceae bacterium OTU4NAUVB1]|nr:dihydrolipoyllysine-residue acetyltransferase [Comamonadaceae bacterium OTU4NAUVB1]
MAAVEVKVPDIGDFDEVAVIEVLVKVGDTVKTEQSLITVESDKASMEIPSSTAGVVKEIKVAVGGKVKEGSVVLIVEAEGGSSAAPAPAAASPAPSAAPAAAAPAAAAPAPASAPAAAAGPVEVKVPDIGDFKDVAVIEVLVKVGDTVKAEQSLITVESDKASMEIPSSHAGVLKELKVKVGDTVNIGDLIAMLEGVGGGSAPAAAPAPAAPAAAPVASAPAPAAAAPAASPASASAPAPAAHNPTVAPSGNLPHASPSVRKFARELGVPLEEVKGTGPKGRITQEDIQGFTRSVMSGQTTTKAAAASAKPAASGGGDGAGLGLIPWPKVDFAKFGAVERKDLSRIKKISGANLHRNWVMIPHVTNNDEADITELEAFRVSTNKENEKSGVKVTMLAFVIKAMVSALRKFPEFNTSLDGDQLVYKQYFNIGFAADTPNGLVVPVLKDADKKGVMQISQEMGELAKKARDGKLGAADMQGGSISISSLGGIGGTHFTPIINAPEVAILGLSKGAMKPVWDGKQFVPRLMLPLSLSFDHRVIDGALAARFNAYLGQVLADFRRVLL